MDSDDVALYLVHQNLKSLQSSIMKDVDRKLTAMIDEVLQDIRPKQSQINEFNKFAKSNNANNGTWKNRLHRQNGKTKDQTERREGSLPDKVFVVRESYLTALLEVNHIKSIFHLFLIMFLMNSVCRDFFVEGRVKIGLGTVQAGLAKIDRVMGIWCLMHIPILGVYYALNLWFHVRQKLMKAPRVQSSWSYLCLTVFIAFQISLLYVGTITCLRLNLPFVSGLVMLLETTRLIMKVYGFVRTNAGKLLSEKMKIDSEESTTQTVQMPPISCYIYYLFAPTLIYRDSYPRTNQIRWKFALNRFLEVLAVAFIYSYIYERHILVHFANYGIAELTNSSLVVHFFGMIIPAFVLLMSGFYLILHAWLNFTAELLRFGDRMYYRDWWTARNYEAYYRYWNMVVHDWLYEYIYKDCYMHIFKRSKLASSMLVFLVSAYMHEHILGFALQMFYPVMFGSFGIFGVLMVYISKNFPMTFGNIFLWFTLIIGASLQTSLYSMEYFARQNCPPTNAENWLEWITPVSWVCNGKR